MEQNDSDILKVVGINSKGYGNIPKLVMQDRRITPEAKCIYGYFASYAGMGNSAFPSVSKIMYDLCMGCLLYTSDAADEEDSVDLGGRRIIKKKKKKDI